MQDLRDMLASPPVESNDPKSIDFRKMLSNLKREAREKSKVAQCLYCNGGYTSFCNSHSIPEFVLRSIASSGMVFTTNALMKIPSLEKESGIKNTGVFRLICNQCDSDLFADYEDPFNYEKEPTGQMLAQIALKNTMKKLSKAQLVLEMQKAIWQQHNISNHITRYANESTLHEIAEVDVREYKKDFDIVKRAVKKRSDSEYRLFYFEKLDYVVPVAFQDSIRPYCDFESNVINNIIKINTRVSELHICIFPLKRSSVVFVFGENDKRTKKYRKFIKQFMKLNPDDKLATICYLSFRYSEDIYIHKNIDQSVIEDESLSRIAGMEDTCKFLPSTPRSKINAKMLEGHALSQRKEIPNLLLPKYAIVQTIQD